MSKELPYFRFTVSEWLNGDISMEQMEDQGLFINVCAFYWFKDCSLASAKLKQKFSFAEGSLNRLLKAEVLKVDEKDNIIIDFLNEQYIKLSELHSVRSIAGRKGGLSKPKAKLKQKRSYKDKDKDRDIITHNQFYKLEKGKAEGRYKDIYIQFVEFLYGKNDMNKPLIKALELKEQVSFDNFCKLMDKIGIINNKKGEQKVLLTEKLKSMYNSPGLLKGKVSLYLTLNNWINREG